jgi:hypothetical protein
LYINSLYFVFTGVCILVAMDSSEGEVRFRAGVDNEHTDDETDHRLAQIDQRIAELTEMKNISRRAEQNRSTSAHSIHAGDRDAKFGRGEETASPTRRQGDQRSTGKAGNAIAAAVDVPTELFSVAAASRDRTF